MKRMTAGPSRSPVSGTSHCFDYAADPGDYVREHGLQRDTDAEIVNREAGKYSRGR